MKELSINLDNTSHKVYIGSELYPNLGEWLKDKEFNKSAKILTNPTVKALYGRLIEEALRDVGFKPEFMEVPDSEKQKSLSTAGRLYRVLSDSGVERCTPIFALGGGVIGDLAGFVAATYMRGIPLIHLPTTLLAQVDSSIGGKTAIDRGKIKNQIGVFYQPSLVVSDIHSLRTLPEREMGNGLAEVIKYAMISDEDFFKYLETNLERIKAIDESVLEETIWRCVQIKAKIIQEDVKDTGIRNILNFGHTCGHAIESASNFSVPHGQAVAIGMLIAGKISYKIGKFSEKDLNKLKGLLVRSGIYKGMPSISEKKFASGNKKR